MELQGHDIPAVLEGLVIAAVAGGQADRAGRYRERVAVPMKGRNLLRKTREQRRCGGRGSECHGKPADLLLPVLCDLPAQHRGDQLSTQAYAKHGDAAIDHPPQELLLADQPRMKIVLIDVHGPPHHDEPVEVFGLRQRLIEVQAGVSQPMPSLAGPGGNIGGIFERHVLQVMNVHENGLQHQVRQAFQPDLFATNQPTDSTRAANAESPGESQVED